MGLHEKRLHRKDKRGTTREKDYMGLHGTRRGRNYNKEVTTQRGTLRGGITL